MPNPLEVVAMSCHLMWVVGPLQRAVCSFKCCVISPALRCLVLFRLSCTDLNTIEDAMKVVGTDYSSILVFQACFGIKEEWLVVFQLDTVLAPNQPDDTVNSSYQAHCKTEVHLCAAAPITLLKGSI